MYFCGMIFRDRDMAHPLRARVFALITILLVISSIGQIFAQDSEQRERKIDSVMALSPAYVPVYTANFPTVFYNPLKYDLLDTSIFHISDYSPFYEAPNIYQSIGINGQAHKSMVFDYERSIDFSMLTLPYPLFFKTQKDLKHYDVDFSYTRLAYTYGLPSEQNFYATHAQKFKHSDLVVNLMGIGNTGYFLHQGVNMLILDALFHYETKDSLYGFTVSYILNHAKFSENGGLSDFHSFADRDVRDTNITNNLSAFNVMFSNASSRINTHDALFQQFVNIRDKKGHYFGTFTHSFQFKRTGSLFSDYNLNNDFYRDHYYFSTDTTKDSLYFYNIINTLQWSNYNPMSRRSERNYQFRFAGGIRHEFVHSRMPRYIANNFSLFARASIRLFSVWDIYGSFAYSFLNYNKNDAIANVAGTFAINRKLRSYLGLEANFYRISPDFIFTHYNGNNNYWLNDWKKQNILKLGAFYTILDYKVSFNYFMLNRYVFLNHHFEPESYEKSINVVQLNLFAPLRVKNFMMDLNVSVQHSTKSYIAVPIFAGKLYAAYQFKIFRKRLNIQIGGDLMYNTLYYADAYNALLHQFYHQGNEQVGNYLYFDLNLTLRVERIAFYVRGGNLLAGVFSFKYFTTPFYPMQGRNLELGITWRFYD